MDAEREWIRTSRSDAPVLTPDPWRRLTGIRNELLQRVVERASSMGRLPQVCLYARSVGGYTPLASLNAAAAFAARHSWSVDRDQSFTDPHGRISPEARAGWSLVRRRIRAGYADGVVVITASVISEDPIEYEKQLDSITLSGGFVAVVAPDARGLR
ncbi:hypothetical protein ACWC9Q_10510 [Streptomyces sp. NPDC001142]